MSQDREERHRLSKARVKNWDNTFAGQRRKKLLARQQRIEAEEAVRLSIDKSFEAEEEALRRESIERAKLLQYYDTDLVKNFHSRVVLLQVMQERDNQILLRDSRSDAERLHDERIQKVANVMLQKDFEKEQGAQKQAKLKLVQLAQDQLTQQKERTLRLQNERNIVLEEGRKTAQADKEYNEKQRELFKKRKDHSLALHKQLIEMKEQVRDRRLMEKEDNRREDARIEAWGARKTLQTDLKKELEEKESLNVRQTLGETQYKISSNADAVVEHQIKLRIQKRDEKAQKEEADKSERKKRNHDELRLFFKNYLKEAEDRKQKKKEEDQATLQEYMRIKEEVVTQQESARVKKLQTGKTIEAFQLKQIEENTQRRNRERDDRLADANARKENTDAEHQALLEYMQRVSKESWAGSNPRLQKYISEEFERSKVPRDNAKKQDTSSRLGFPSK